LYLWLKGKSIGESLGIVTSLEVSDDLLNIWDGSLNISNAGWEILWSTEWL